MFSNRTVNPSPNRTSIKEANDHLQLLHERVMELESTTHQQSEALKEKDELLETTVRDITELKDTEIHTLASMIDQLRDRIKKLEHLLREKDQQIEILNHRCSLAEDVASYTPAVEKLLSAMKKLPYKSVKHNSSKPKSRAVRSHGAKVDRKLSADASNSHDGLVNSVDGHASIPNQSFTDLRIDLTQKPTLKSYIKQKIRIYTSTFYTNPMMMSAISGHYGLFEAIRYKRHRQAMLLAEAGIDVDCRNERGQTPLIYTVVAVDDCSRSRTKLVKLFLEAGADPNAADWKGLTALMHASILGQAETVKPLLECVWTNPCVTDPNGNTALMYAASHGHQEVIAVFLSVSRNNLKSLQLHNRNSDGFTALHLAVRNRHDACSRLLTKEGQFFPTAIDEFPDPKDLDRDPTPTDTDVNLDRSLESVFSAMKQKPYMKTDDKRTTGTMTLDPEDLDLINNSYLSVLECSVGDLPAWNFTHPFGLQTTKSTQVISLDHRKPTPEVSENIPKETNDVLEDKDEPESNPETPLKIDDWPVIPLQLKPVPQKLLQPLMPIDITNVQHSNGNTFQRKCLLKQGNRSMSGLRIKIHDSRDISVSHIRNAHNGDASDNIISGSSLKSVHLKRSKQSNGQHEIVSNVLPLISSKDNNLPPVRYSLRRTGSSKKESVCFPAAPLITVRADQTPREMEMFKKNVIAFS